MCIQDKRGEHVRKVLPVRTSDDARNCEPLAEEIIRLGTWTWRHAALNVSLQWRDRAGGVREGP